MTGRCGRHASAPCAAGTWFEARAGPASAQRSSHRPAAPPRAWRSAPAAAHHSGAWLCAWPGQSTGSHRWLVPGVSDGTPPGAIARRAVLAEEAGTLLGSGPRPKALPPSPPQRLAAVAEPQRGPRRRQRRAAQRWGRSTARAPRRSAQAARGTRGASWRHRQCWGPSHKRARWEQGLRVCLPPPR